MPLEPTHIEMPTAPLVSVVVTAYQHEKYIVQCIESIAAQQCNFVFEIVIGEDDSTDNTRGLCKQLAEKYPHLIRLFLHDKSKRIFINGKQTGRYNLMACMTATNGKYIAHCDGDDYWTDANKLQNQIDLMQAQNASYSFHDVRIFFEDTQQFNSKLFLADKNMERVKTIAPVLTDIYTQWPIHTSSFILKKPEYFPDFMFKIMHGDMGFFAIAIQGGKGVFYDTVASVYRVHKTSFMRTTNFSLSDRMQAMLLIDSHYGNPNAPFIATYFSEATRQLFFIKKNDFNRSYYYVSFKHIFRLFALNLRFRFTRKAATFFRKK